MVHFTIVVIFLLNVNIIIILRLSSNICLSIVILRCLVQLKDLILLQLQGDDMVSLHVPLGNFFCLILGIFEADTLCFYS